MNYFLKVLATVTMLTIIVAGLSISYYYVIFLPKKEHAEMESHQQARLVKEQVGKHKEALLNSCLLIAEAAYSKWGGTLVEKAKKCSKFGKFEGNCMELYAKELEKNEAKLQQDKDNCFKQYPPLEK